MLIWRFGDFGYVGPLVWLWFYYRRIKRSERVEQGKILHSRHVRMYVFEERRNEKMQRKLIHLKFVYILKVFHLYYDPIQKILNKKMIFLNHILYLKIWII